MNRKVKCYQAVIFAIIFYTVILLGLLGPGKILETDRVVVGTENIAGETIEMDPDPGRIIQQVFIADGGYLRYLDIYVTSPESAGKFIKLMVYDETNEILYNEEVKLSETDVFPGYMRLPVGIQTVPGRAYVWQLESPVGAMRLGWQHTGETGMTNLGYYYSIWYGEITTYEAQNVLMRQVYTQAPSAAKMAALMGGITVAALMACGAVAWLGRRKKMLQGAVRVQQILWATAAPVFYAFLAWLSWGALLQNRFGAAAADKVVYALGILIAALGFGYVVFTRRKADRDKADGQLDLEFLTAYFEKHGADWLQTAAFAGVLWGCIDYMNALYQFYQDAAYRVVLLWAGFVLLSMCPGVRLAGKVSSRWLQAAGMAALAIYRCRLDIGDGQQEVLKAILTRYDIMVGIMAVLVLAALAMLIYRKKFAFAQLRKGYALLLGLFFVGLILFRNTRGWAICLVVIFGLFYLFYLGWENRGRLLANFSSGVVLNFAAAALFCMARRPVRGWYFYRYNLVFHTVTVTATYLTLVICVLTVRLFMMLHSRKKAYEFWGTLLLYGMALSFLFMTLSRTGYLAAIAVTLVLLPFVTFWVYRESAAELLKKVGIMAAVAAVCLPLTYCSVRLLPAVYNDPYLFDLEDSSAAVHVDEAKDSTKYMSIRRFLDVMEEKLFSDATNLRQDAEEFLLCISNLEEGDIYVRPVEQLVVSSSDTGAGEVGDMSNGRIEIFGMYIREWNLFGHEEMGVPNEEGEMIVHAHNTYLQVIHDFGLITGLLFVAFGLYSCVLMFLYAMNNVKEEPFAVLPLAIFIGFAVAGLVEWLFHPCNPIGFSVMVVFAPLLCKNKKVKKKKSLVKNADK